MLLNNRHCEKSNKSQKKFCPTNEQVGEQCCFFGQIENDALDNKSCLFESSAFKNSSKMTISCVFFNNRLLNSSKMTPSITNCCFFFIDLYPLKSSTWENIELIIKLQKLCILQSWMWCGTNCCYASDQGFNIARTRIFENYISLISDLRLCSREKYL